MENKSVYKQNNHKNKRKKEDKGVKIRKKHPGVSKEGVKRQTS